MNGKEVSMDALTAIRTRQSPLRLGEPAPDDTTLRQALSAAVSAPDHGRLRPWRFLIVRGEARSELAEVLAQSRSRREPSPTEAELAREREKAFRAPLIVVAAAHPVVHPKVPEIEQIIATGAAVQNLLLAVHALGYGAFWRTGEAAYDSAVKAAFGLAPQDSIVGLLYIGTPLSAPPPRPEIPLNAVVWHGPEKTVPF
jgi:nitroreductase